MLIGLCVVFVGISLFLWLFLKASDTESQEEDDEQMEWIATYNKKHSRR